MKKPIDLMANVPQSTATAALPPGTPAMPPAVTAEVSTSAAIAATWQAAGLVVDDFDGDDEAALSRG